MLLDDSGIVRRVGRRRSVELQRDEKRRVSDRLEKAGPAQLVRDRYRVGRLSLRVQRDNGFEDVGVGGLVEVLGRASLHTGCDRVAGQEHRPDQGFLCLEVVRWDASTHHLQMTGPRRLSKAWTMVQLPFPGSPEDR